MKRATSEEITIDDLYTISIHALVKRATPLKASIKMMIPVFQSTPS